MRTPARTLAAIVLAFGAACGTSNELSYLVVTKTIRATILAAGSSANCVFDPGTAEAVYGTFNPTAAGSYLMALVVENRLVNNGNPLAGRLNTNDFQVENARINYEFPDPALKLSVGEHLVAANGVIKAGASNSVGVVLIPADVATALTAAVNNSVRVKVRLEGKLLDGSSAKSSEYEYVVRICSNCGTAVPACTAPAVPVVCGFGQDGTSGCF